MADLRREAIIATGHVDGNEVSGSAQRMRLSVDRAEAVKRYLIFRGVQSNLVFVDGKGATQPITSGPADKDRFKNRRVELEIVGTRIKSAVTPEESAPPKGVVAVLFATTRKKSGDNDPYRYFTSDESTEVDLLTRGRVFVSIPPDRRKGEISEPGFFMATLEKITSSSAASFLGMTPVKAANPKTDFAFAGAVEEFNSEQFQKTLRNSLDRTDSKQAIVYVHGFANSFKDAAFRTAQFTYDLSDESYVVVPVLFSWPSDPAGFNYIGATDRLWSAGKQLAIFLKELTDNTGVGKIHIIAHSKGAQVLGIALDQLRAPNLLADSGKDASLVPLFNQIILAAPDIRAADFEALVMPAVASHHRITNYVSSNDAALRMSKKANSGERAGDSGQGLRLVAGVETIDVSSVNYRPGGHSSFADSLSVLSDIRQLLKGIPPEKRGLQHIKRKNLGFWILPK